MNIFIDLFNKHIFLPCVKTCTAEINDSTKKLSIQFSKPGVGGNFSKTKKEIKTFSENQTLREFIVNTPKRKVKENYSGRKNGIRLKLVLIAGNE